MAKIYHKYQETVTDSRINQRPQITSTQRITSWGNCHRPWVWQDNTVDQGDSKSDRKVKVSCAEMRSLPAEPHLWQLTAFHGNISWSTEVSWEKQQLMSKRH